MHDDGLDTVVAGVRCREVLGALSDYLDGDLLPVRVAQLQAHLAECDRCTRFGADVAAVLTGLRTISRTPTAAARWTTTSTRSSSAASTRSFITLSIA